MSNSKRNKHQEAKEWAQLFSKQQRDIIKAYQKRFGPMEGNYKYMSRLVEVPKSHLKELAKLKGHDPTDFINKLQETQNRIVKMTISGGRRRKTSSKNT